MKHNGTKRKGFTLLEVVIALGMLALIAVPAIGLATMAVSRNKELLVTGDASELKNRLDVAIRAYQSGGTNMVFSTSFANSQSPDVFYASSDLLYIEESESVSVDNDKYYKISVLQPVNCTFSSSDMYRILEYDVSWPNDGSAPASNQLFFTTVFRR